MHAQIFTLRQLSAESCQIDSILFLLLPCRKAATMLTQACAFLLIQRYKVPGVYNVPCECGTSYVRQTGQLVSISINEHKHHVRLGQTDKSAITQHCWLKGHQALFADTKILYRSDKRHKQITRESLEMALTEQSLNQEEGARLSSAWLLLYGKLAGEKEWNQFDSYQLRVGAMRRSAHACN